MIRLSDYKSYGWRLEQVHLDFALFDDYATVNSQLQLHRLEADAPLFLNGESIELVCIQANGIELHADEYQLNEQGLTLLNPTDDLNLRIQVKIKPDENTQLQGLYRSHGLYCTQCEAQGFRRITFFPDRPDVLSQYKVRIEADQATNPVLLSNGDCIEQGPCDNQRHYVVYHDPHPKPCYLFAMVAGQLEAKFDTFTTAEGRTVQCGIYAEPHNIDKCDFALIALKKSMAWDEQRFQLSYDLDEFNIVAVDHFNAGAMENKGLNVFNAKLVFASPELATDLDYERIESVIAHEYFHNWTGNRVTCRDWFQLTLKEGLTVFRDQEFTRDLRDGVCKRIEDAQLILEYQFAEDSGALSHPIQPKAYEEVNNFYTLTVYEKGAEVIRIYQTLLGKAGFAKGLQHYLQKNDGTGATVADFWQAMGEANDRDLSFLQPWYDVAGTPELFLKTHWDDQGFHIHLRQQSGTGALLPIPFKYGVLDPDGGIVQPDSLYLLDSESTTLHVPQAPKGSVLSPLRDFSAPVRLRWDVAHSDQLKLAQYDGNAFNRWFAMQQLYSLVLLDKLTIEPVIEVLRHNLSDSTLSPRLRSYFLRLPRITAMLSNHGQNIDELCQRHLKLAEEIGQQLQATLLKHYQQLGHAVNEPYAPNPEQIGLRALKNQCLHYLTVTDPSHASQQFDQANNMSDRMAAIVAVLMRPKSQCQRREALLKDFYEMHKDEPLMLDKWFSLSVSPPIKSSLAVAENLLIHPDFDWLLPNRVRAVLGTLMQNPHAFHQAQGYELVVKALQKVDALNPQLAARLYGQFDGIQYLPNSYKNAAKACLQSALDETCSINSRELIEKIIRQC